MSSSDSEESEPRIGEKRRHIHVSSDGEEDAVRSPTDDVVADACDGVTLQQALVSLAGKPLTRNSRFVDVLFKSCDSWKHFALLEATDKLVAFDPKTRLWCTTPRQVHALFNDTLLKEARQLLKDEEERKTEARMAAALAAELAATSKKPKGGIFIDDMAAVGGGGEAEADDEKTPPSWVDWGMQATGLDLVLKVLRASLQMHGCFVRLDENLHLTNFTDALVETRRRGRARVPNAVGRKLCLSLRAVSEAYSVARALSGQ